MLTQEACSARSGYSYTGFRPTLMSLVCIFKVWKTVGLLFRVNATMMIYRPFLDDIFMLYVYIELDFNLLQMSTGKAKSEF